jgi:hypothetical protein
MWLGEELQTSIFKPIFSGLLLYKYFGLFYVLTADYVLFFIVAIWRFPFAFAEWADHNLCN